MDDFLAEDQKYGLFVMLLSFKMAYFYQKQSDLHIVSLFSVI